MPRRSVLLLLACLAVPVFSSAAERPTAAAVPVVATYFHRTLRCQTCLTIEALARHDVLTELAAEVESGQLEWRLVNFEEPGNAHFVADFGLAGPALVVTRRVGGTIVAWERLDRAWELYGDVDAFDAYVLEAVGRFLDAASETADAPAD